MRRLTKASWGSHIALVAMASFTCGCESITTAPQLQVERTYVETDNLPAGDYLVRAVPNHASLVVDVNGAPGVIWIADPPQLVDGEGEYAAALTRLQGALLGQYVHIEPTGRVTKGLNDRYPPAAIVDVRVEGQSFAEFAAEAMKSK